ncbi:MBOAT family O-acyltransferase [Ferruginibacter sp.]
MAFSGQIFFDFAGYSTCAIGVALTLGFVLPENFRYPYAASGFSDFWRRWHITLSAWLRDYLYIPLGGNRKGEARTYINLMITMLLGGLWHGASWTFVVWGALHGFYLCIERLIKEKFRPTPEPVLADIPVQRAGIGFGRFGKRGNELLLVLLTFFCVTITWVFFRAPDFTSAWRLLTSMFGQARDGVPILLTLDILKVGIVVFFMLSCHWLMRNTSVLQVARKINWWVLGIVWALLLMGVIISQKSGDSFIYFQF